MLAICIYYSTSLSYIILPLTSVINSLINIIIIVHSFPRSIIKLHGFPGLENEIPNFIIFQVL